jgi:hypothetical protein
LRATRQYQKYGQNKHGLSSLLCVHFSPKSMASAPGGFSSEPQNFAGFSALRRIDSLPTADVEKHVCPIYQ